MSLHGRLVLDELPDDRFLKNPLRTREAAPALRVTAAPNAKTVATRVNSGLFGLRKSGDAEVEPVGDNEDEDDEDEDHDDQPGREGELGPFTLLSKTNKTKLVFVAGFKDMTGSASVNIRFSDIVKAADNPEVAGRLNTFDPTRTVPISLRVLGTSLGEAEKHCALEVYDATGKPLFSRFVHKHHNSDAVYTSGYPLFLFAKGGSNMILFNPPALSNDHKNYWSFTMETLEKNTSSYVNPSTNEHFKIIKKNSRCAALLDYALSVKNRVVIPRLLQNPAYQLPDDPDNIRVPLDMYTKTRDAYRKKLSEIQSSSYDLSTIKVVLKPLELAKETKAFQPEAVAGHAVIEVVAHIPKKADLQDDQENIQEYMHRVSAVGGDDASDEEF